MLESKLGDHWLGMDIGEQDGRYIGGYAPQLYPMSGSRFEQYLNFQRHFEAMGNELGNKLSTLVSLNFGHYFLKEGTYTTIGAETAQGLPNGQVYYAFIRGAGKQYGVPWFGNASVWNRWGYKTYEGEGEDHGPTHGTSLNLLKRLMYGHILYNCVFVGFESSWFQGAELSPVGRMQQTAQQWVRANGQPGAMLTPVALMTDHFAGWTFPRHLYTDHVYRVWGNLPYGPGDYFTDHVLDMLYPGYQDSSFYHDESGFNTPTPYGDLADCLLSDAEPWLLAQYALIIVTGELPDDLSVRDRLEEYVAQGGELIITAGNLKQWPSLCQVRPGGELKSFTAGTAPNEEEAFSLLGLPVPPEAEVLAECDGVPAAVRYRFGQGRMTVLASAFGLGEQAHAELPLKNEIDQPLATPYAMLRHVRAVLDGALREQALFTAGEGLSVITCRRAPGEYTLGICNNGLAERPLNIASQCGTLTSLEELPLDQSEKGQPGYVPAGCESATLGVSTASTIAGGDVRVFRVRVEEQGVEEIPHQKPAARNKGRILPLHGAGSIKEFVLARPSFFAHLDGVKVDWRYLQVRDIEALGEESKWLQRQGLRIVVDLTSGINLYPDLRLVDNDPVEYPHSIEVISQIIEKSAALGARDLVLSLHRAPENNFTAEQARASFVESLRQIAARAAQQEIQVHLRTSTKAAGGLREVAALVNEAGSPNLHVAASLALLAEQHWPVEDCREIMRQQGGLWLAAAPEHDIAGRLWSINGNLADWKEAASLWPYLDQAPDLA
ncbi:MAG: TIM barrel protein, partial [Candidatus Hydrogenedentes bacterium]|nr:TIM barrel protein [Candidatus Hydrogenedentota bacterium]